ncbi:MAG: tRNA (cytidine(34)-2'-O)-methyltransferase [Pseudomonadota bacterium]|nr:tRNA (cytidine(34)-2'-O)-methyltransferase [Pseudomonadota bacterium]
MVAIVLVQPEIPPNTGNVIRLAANSGAELHLVEPLGFRLTDRELKRAGLDYHEYTRLIVHANWAACLAKLGTRTRYALTTRGQRSLFACELGTDDVFVFGRETSGLPEEVLADFPDDARVRIPMQPRVRSLNISNAVAITVYEAWRQAGFAGAC